MGLNYLDLNDQIRQQMLTELQRTGCYPSPRLTERGLQLWPKLLEQAIKFHTDVWLARELKANSCLKSRESRKLKTGKVIDVQVPQGSAEMLAEGEFNRFYLMGLCLEAKAKGISFLVVYRAKQVENPRPESERKIGQTVNIDELLNLLRVNDFVAIAASDAIPGGPNSGISARFPNEVERANLSQIA